MNQEPMFGPKMNKGGPKQNGIWKMNLEKQK